MGNLDFSQLLGEIKSKGYWEVNIRPLKFEETRINSLDRCWDLMETCQVSLRGWPYPYVAQDHDRRQNGIDWIQSGVKFTEFGHIETWRLYQSGQFIHYLACNEDYYGPERISKGLSIVSTLYRITEIFEFAVRLAMQKQEQVLGSGARISITLFDMKGRELFFWKPGRHLSLSYVCHIDEIPFKREFTDEELISGAHQTAIDATIHVFQRFNWNNIPRSVLDEDQQRLLEKRL